MVCMGLHILEMTKGRVRAALIGTLVYTGNLSENYRGDLSGETLEVDSLGVYNIALELGDRLGVDISDEMIKDMFGSFEMDMSNIGTPRNNVKASDIVDYISARL